MEKALIIKNLCSFLLDDKKNECIDFATTHYPFANNPVSKRQYSKYEMCKVFLRDGFIDGYSGDKLLFPGLIKLLTIEFPDIFKYHKNWKMTETHIVYWELFPTIDHLIPIARGGQDIESNWITTSMIRNSAKSNWTIEELNWKLHNSGQLDNRDGLINCFLDLSNKNPLYEKDSYINAWKVALLRAKGEIQY
jgi:hypothetical protein